MKNKNFKSFEEFINENNKVNNNLINESINFITVDNIKTPDDLFNYLSKDVLNELNKFIGNNVSSSISFDLKLSELNFNNKLGTIECDYKSKSYNNVKDFGIFSGALNEVLLTCFVKLGEGEHYYYKGDTAGENLVIAEYIWFPINYNVELKDGNRNQMTLQIDSNKKNIFYSMKDKKFITK